MIPGNLLLLQSPFTAKQYFPTRDPILPTITIYKEQQSPYQFEPSPLHLDPRSVKFTWHNKPKTVDEALKETNTDALIVLKDGKLVYERYFTQNPVSIHRLYSVTKSFAGLMAATLIHEGKMKRSDPITHYVPELKGTAYDQATISNLLEQTVGAQFNENYLDPTAEIIRFSMAALIGPQSSIRKALQRIHPKGENGKKLHYMTPNLDTLCWVSERASHRTFPNWLNKTLWSKMGMARNAHIITDSHQVGFCGGGLEATAIDLAKVGQMLLQEGFFNGQQLIPRQVIQEITRGGDKQVFAHGDAVLFKDR